MVNHVSDTWQAMCHNAWKRPMHVGHKAHGMVINRSSQLVRRGGGATKRKGKEKGRKGEKGKGEKKERKERKKRKRKRKRERGRRPIVSSSVHWRSDGRNLLDQGVKSRDSTRGYASRG